jgi:RNA polymerase sigma factor (sigma-70 family)
MEMQEGESFMDQLSRDVRRVEEISRVYNLSESKGVDAAPIMRGDSQVGYTILVKPPAGLRENFEQVASECRSKLFAAALSIVRDRDLAEDVVQEALIKAHAHLTDGKNYIVRRNRLSPLPTVKESEANAPEAEEIRKPLAWLRVIVYNTAKNYCISRKTRIVRLQGKIREELEDEFEDRMFEQPEFALIRSEENAALWSLVDGLRPRMRTVIKLRYLLEDDYQVIADKLHCPINTVRSDLKRGREILREVMIGQRIVREGRVGRKLGS